MANTDAAKAVFLLLEMIGWFCSGFGPVLFLYGLVVRFAAGLPTGLHMSFTGLLAVMGALPILALAYAGQSVVSIARSNAMLLTEVVARKNAAEG